MLFTDFMRDFMFPEFNDFFSEANRATFDAEKDRNKCCDCDRSCPVCDVPDEDVATPVCAENYNVYPVTTTPKNGCWNLNLNSDGYFLNQRVPCGKEDCEIEVVDNTYVKITYNFKEKIDSNGFSHTCNRSGVFSITLPFDADASTLKAKYEDGAICFTVEKVKEVLEGTVKIELN